MGIWNINRSQESKKLFFTDFLKKSNITISLEERKNTLKRSLQNLFKLDRFLGNFLKWNTADYKQDWKYFSA